MRHRGGAPNATQLASYAKVRRAARAKPNGPTFSAEELAFFWEPRPWVPDILERFAKGRPGSSDIRDAIIASDDEGGDGHLHWLKDVMSWVLTDSGKQFVTLALSTRRLRIAREWASTSGSVKVGSVGVVDPKLEEIPVELSQPREETREDELARLIAEQACDE